MANKLLIFDGNALVHRAYHALPPLTSRDGKLANAVYGFFSSVLATLSLFEPTYALFAFDVAGPTFRDTLYKEYKATRVAADQALYDQISIIRGVLDAMAAPVFGVSGYEADDVIATLVAQIQNAKFKMQNTEVSIVTGDNDALQLVDKQVSVYSLARGIKQAHIYDEQKVIEKYGFAPAYLTDYKALAGDASDNIKGVAGIGPKAALKLITEYGHVEAMVARSEVIQPHRNEVLLAKQIVTMVRDVPLDIDFSRSVVSEFDWAAARAKFTELGFTSLLKRLPNITQPTLL